MQKDYYSLKVFSANCVAIVAMKNYHSIPKLISGIGFAPRGETNETIESPAIAIMI